MLPKSAWLTLNRACNLRCMWCYAQSTGYNSFDKMPLERAFKIIDIISEMNIKHISLIGGEPTIYSDLIEVIQYANKKGISCGLITNGLMLHDNNFLLKLLEAGVNSIGFSLKGYSHDDYIKVTGIDGYKNSLIAIANMVNSGIQYSVSMVLGSENIKTFLKGVRDAKDRGASNFYFSFEFDFSSLEKKTKEFDFENKVFRVIDGFYEIYEELCRITEGNFVLHQTFPLCIWDDSFLNILKARQQIHTSCQLLQGSGLIFNTNGDLLPCNALHNYPIGKFGVDFTTSYDLKKFINSNTTCEFYKHLSSVPSEKCFKCDKWEFCGGGCLSNWFHYDLDTLIKKFSEYKNCQI